MDQRFVGIVFEKFHLIALHGGLLLYLGLQEIMMERNREAAIRGREMAVAKMKNKDFNGAQKILLEAHELSPDLENISQLLNVCNVHCAAEARMNGEMDWYQILQVKFQEKEKTTPKVGDQDNTKAVSSDTVGQNKPRYSMTFTFPDPDIFDFEKLRVVNLFAV